MLTTTLIDLLISLQRAGDRGQVCDWEHLGEGPGVEMFARVLLDTCMETKE